MTDASEPTLIWSGEHQAWWRAPANGYTADILAAGVYPYEEAHKKTSHCGPEKRIALQSAEKMLREHFFGLSQTDPASVFNTLRRSLVIDFMRVNYFQKGQSNG